MIKSIYRFLNEIGLDIRKIIAIKNLPIFFKDLSKLKLQSKNKWKFGKLNPQLHDRNDNAGVMNGHYFHHDLIVAQKIFKNGWDNWAVMNPA